MKTIKIYATEVVRYEKTFEINDEDFDRLIKDVNRYAYSKIAETWLDYESATDSEFDGDGVDIYLQQSDGKLEMLFPEDEDN